MTTVSQLQLPDVTVVQPPAAVSTRPRRFTIDGSDSLERHLERTRSEVRAAVLHALPTGCVEAILLGGGYGRGEGGVLRTKTGDRPYNDLEFYVALSGPRLLNEWRYGAVLRELAHELSLLAGIEVEFKVFSLPELRAGPVTMFSYDLVMGHRWVYGDDRLLAGCEHHRKAERIPLDEATRLLMNRCSGLLFARERLLHAEFNEDDADYVGRNLAKARLALGDAMLAATGRYHWSCRERHDRLRELLLLDDAPAWLTTVIQHHRVGVDFKLHPQRTQTPRLRLRIEHEQLSRLARDVWLWVESRRLDRPFGSVRDYALSGVNKCPRGNPWRNLLLHLRTFGPSGVFTAKSLRYPRERLFNSLALLLWGPTVLSDEVARDAVQRELQTSALIPTQLVAAYERVWSRFR